MALLYTHDEDDDDDNPFFSKDSEGLKALLPKSKQINTINKCEENWKDVT